MSKEYIEREDAKARLRIWITDCVLDGENEAADCFRDCIDLLDGIPAADVVEVVRCRDCKHSYRIDGAKEEYYCAKISAFAKFFPGDHFCGYGERKTDG